MSRPFKHSRTGICWLRKAVPAELRGLVGKREELKSPGTRDPDEAKRLFSIALAELEVRWAHLRKGSQSLSEREANDLAVGIFDRLIEAHGQNPSELVEWRHELYDRLWLTSPLAHIRTVADGPRSVHESKILDTGALDRSETWD